MLRKVCLLLGRERHCSRARASPRATSSRRTASSVLLCKVATIFSGPTTYDARSTKVILVFICKAMEEKEASPNLKIAHLQYWGFQGPNKVK